MNPPKYNFSDKWEVIWGPSPIYWDANLRSITVFNASGLYLNVSLFSTKVTLQTPSS
jgi:hypothetical protein